MDDIEEFLETVSSKEDLAALVDLMRQDLTLNPETWENTDLESFLEAMSAWLRSMDGYYRNIGEAMPHAPSWKMIGEILLAASSYE